MGTLTSWDLAKKAQVQERKEWIKNACSNIMKRMNQGVLGVGEGRGGLVELKEPEDLRGPGAGTSS